jgi:hypothetical protein
LSVILPIVPFVSNMMFENPWSLPGLLFSLYAAELSLIFHLNSDGTFRFSSAQGMATAA